MTTDEVRKRYVHILPLGGRPVGEGRYLDYSVRLVTECNGIAVSYHIARADAEERANRIAKVLAAIIEDATP